MNNGTIELSEIERLKMENFALKHNMLQSQLQLIMTERQAFVRSLEDSHPGYVWNDTQGLVPSGAQKISVVGKE